MSKHTKAPWRYEELACEDSNGDGYVYDSQDRCVCHAGDSTGIQGRPETAFPADENKANGILIAAAPDLLEAIEQIVYEADNRNDGEPQAEIGWDDIDKARAAIAKAKGEA